LPELAGLLLAISALGAAIFFIANSHNALWGSILTALGTVGITSAGIVARLKVTAGTLIGQLQKLVTVDIIKANSLYLPPHPHGGIARLLPTRENVLNTLGAQLLRLK
jgi:hypothetical protein